MYDTVTTFTGSEFQAYMTRSLTRIPKLRVCNTTFHLSGILMSPVILKMHISVLIITAFLNDKQVDYDNTIEIPLNYMYSGQAM